MSKDIECIYVDLDGVLANFEKRWEELFDVKPKKDQNRSHWNEFVEGGNFEKLEPMPDFKTGIKYLMSLDKPISILSSTGNERQYDVISGHKEAWLDKHNVDFPAIFVPGKKLKKNFAEKGALLIDDDKKTIEEWEKEGGIGIHHKNWKDTLTYMINHLTKPK